MRLGKLLEQRAEDAELGLEGLRVGRPQRAAVTGILGRGDPAPVKGGEAYSFAGHGANGDENGARTVLGRGSRRETLATYMASPEPRNSTYKCSREFKD